MAYYNSYLNPNPVGYSYTQMPTYQPVQQIPQQQTQYMINVDGEAAAKSWQSPVAPLPNMIVPLFDVDGEHVYFKSYDAYGRMNPIRKGRIVFEDEPQTSETAAPKESNLATVDYINSVKQDIIQSVKQLLQNQNNQNKNNNNRGDRS